jgi:hypothetical protein
MGSCMHAVGFWRKQISSSLTLYPISACPLFVHEMTTDGDLVLQL